MHLGHRKKTFTSLAIVALASLEVPGFGLSSSMNTEPESFPLNLIGEGTFLQLLLSGFLNKLLEDPLEEEEEEAEEELELEEDPEAATTEEEEDIFFLAAASAAATFLRISC